MMVVLQQRAVRCWVMVVVFFELLHRAYIAVRNDLARSSILGEGPWLLLLQLLLRYRC